MPFNGSGTFVSLAPPDFPALPFTTILASMFNANMNDIFTNGLTNCLTRDGQSPPTANLPMAGFKLTGLGNGNADSDSAALGQTLALRGQVGAVDWNTRVSTGLFEATAASLTAPASNFPPTSELGQLVVVSQGATVMQVYETAAANYTRQKILSVWTAWRPEIGNKNYVLNGSFQLWQDVTSLSSGTGIRFGADMYRYQSTGTVYSMIQQAWPVGQSDVPTQASFFCRYGVSSVAGAANFAYMQNFVEGVRTLAGKQITFSFWVKGNISGNVAVEIVQSFGTGGSPSASVITFVGLVPVTTSWSRQQVSVLLPSIAGKTVGSDNNDNLSINAWVDAGSNFASRVPGLGQQSLTLDTFGWKLEEGSKMTAFEVPPYTDESLRIFRYFASFPSGSSIGPVLFSGNVTSGNNYSARTEFLVPMRTVPTLTFVDGGGSVNFPAAGTATPVTTVGFRVFKVSSATGVGFFSGNYIADARLP